MVGFVDDDQVPIDGGDLLASLFGPRSPGVRGDDRIVMPPHIVHALILEVLNGGLVVDRECLIELRLELELPLSKQTRWDQDQHPGGLLPGAEFFDDHRCLDGLAEAYLIAEEKPMGVVGDGPVDNRDLVGSEVDPSVGKRHEWVVEVLKPQVGGNGLEVEVECPAELPAHEAFDGIIENGGAERRFRRP